VIGRELIKRSDVSLGQVKSILEKRKKEGELSYEQKVTYEYARSQGKIGPRKAQELIAKLMEIPSIDERLAVMIVDNPPKDKEDITLFFERKRNRPTDAEVKKILDLIAEYTA